MVSHFLRILDHDWVLNFIFEQIQVARNYSREMFHLIHWLLFQNTFLIHLYKAVEMSVNYHLTNISKKIIVRKGQFPASQGRMKKETNGQSADIQLNRPPLSLMQAAAFLKKRGHSTTACDRDRDRLPFCFLYGTFLTIHWIQFDKI